MENYREESMREIHIPEEAAEQPRAALAAEIDGTEQREMDSFAEIARSESEAAEQQEMNEGAKLGYSSDYYEHQMAVALENDNKTAYKNAEKNWAKAKAKERTSD